jgi:antitoxin (DNA-binding transcriptional repressor) of toxin-antitoxin stability system
MRTMSFEEFHEDRDGQDGESVPDEELTVTRDGVPIARLRPLSSHPKPPPEVAVRALREFRKREKLSLGVSIREAREEGRM